jgi:hypothetical protein
LENGGKVLKENEIQYTYSAGLGADYKINSLITLKTVLFFDREFVKNDIYGTDERNMPIHIGNISYNYDYLILPILGSFSTQGKVTLHFDAGPYFGYLLNQKTKISYNIYIPPQNIEGKGIRKQFDFGINIATGTCFPITKKVLFDLGFQANFGLINISENQDADNGSIKTNSIGLLFGIKYKI